MCAEMDTIVKTGDRPGCLKRVSIPSFMMRGAIRRGTIEIKVAGKNDTVQFEEEFLISDDGCHVSKEAGPDTIFVEVN